MSLESTASLARPNTKSLRATIPEGIVAFLELENGDKLEWKMEFDKGKKMVMLKKTDSTKKIASKYAKVKKTK